MGPRKRARTKAPSVEESTSAVAAPETPTSSTPGTANPNDAANIEEDTPTPLKGIKPESSSSKQVGPLWQHTPRQRLTYDAGQAEEQLVWNLATQIHSINVRGQGDDSGRQASQWWWSISRSKSFRAQEISSGHCCQTTLNVPRQEQGNSGYNYGWDIGRR